MTTDRPGLREQKKAATRDALSWAALRLVVERGLENVRVEDIAAAAGVSPRTYNNYFSSKAEAIMSRHTDRVHRIAEALRTRPADEPLWEALTHSVLLPFDGEVEPPKSWWTSGVRLLLQEPTLRGELARATTGTQATLAAAVAARTGTDPARDLYPKLVAATLLSALNAATDQWIQAEPTVPLRPLLLESLRLLAAGLPDPSSSA